MVFRCQFSMTYMTVFHGYKEMFEKCGYVLDIRESELFLEAKEATSLKVRDRHFSPSNRTVSGYRTCDDFMTGSRVS